MRLILASATIALSLVTTTATGQTAAQSISGTWRTDDGKAVITVAPCAEGSAALCGRISRFLVAEPAGGARDTNNPNRALRSRSLMGVSVLSNLRWSDGAWRGSGYSPEEGRNFNATVRTEGGRLSIRGCVSLFCRTVVWARAR